MTEMIVHIVVVKDTKPQNDLENHEVTCWVKGIGHEGQESQKNSEKKFCTSLKTQEK